MTVKGLTNSDQEFAEFHGFESDDSRHFEDQNFPDPETLRKDRLLGYRTRS